VIALCLSWWMFLRPAADAVGVARGSPGPMLSVELTPVLVADDESVAAVAPPAAAPDAEAAAEEGADDSLGGASAPPPPELGTPEGELREELGAKTTETDSSEPAPDPPSGETLATEASSAESSEPEAAPTPRSESSTNPAEASSSVAAQMRDPSLLAAAEEEISGKERRGFTTVFLAAPEAQLAIARYFGEELVLVPRAAIDPEANDPRWYRVDGSPERVEEVRGRPPLEQYRQYRDLLDYPYARLPDVLRELRRRAISRRDVYVFAALVPVREWAVVVARRNEVLTQAGRDLSDVRSFVLRYLDLGDGTFDLAVEDVVFADGAHYHPLRKEEEKEARTQ
jgi:hypothetical protein